MRFAASLTCLLCALVLGGASGALAAQPPNNNDPCSSAGRDTCGTTGVGFYKVYKYGIRWFGDYRGAVPGAAHTLCIDLSFWYPSAAYQYKEQQPETGLRNVDGEAVTSDRQQKLAYAIWNYGRSTDENQQAAVMLYVHSLMGDARPGEADPAALNPTVVALYTKIAQNATRFHGPYRIETRVPDSLAVSKPATATIRVLSAAGEALPNLQLTLSAKGASGLPAGVKTDGQGIARVTFKPEPGLRLTVQTEELASTLPRIFRATVGAAAKNGQRLAVPSPQTVSATVTPTVSKSQIVVSTLATPGRVVVGEASKDRVTISGALASWQGKVTVRIHGPFAALDAIRCDQKPVFEGSFSASGSGVYMTPPATFSQVGYYTYVEVVPGDAGHIGLTTPCAAAGESFKVEAQPQVKTVVSEQRIAPGTAITDNVTVSGLAGQAVTVQAALFGPFPAREAIRCDGAPVWTGSLAVPTDGQYKTDAFTVTTPGFYTYREQIASSELVRAATTACADVAETTVVTGKPKVITAASAQQTAPGARITDKVVVTGLGALSVAVQVELWGPFATRSGISCSGTPYWKGVLIARGDGTYTTAAVKIERAGFYTYHESIAAGAPNDAYATPCGEVAETTFAHAKPIVTTLASDEIVRPGSSLFDRIRVEGVGRTAVPIEVRLFGPFGSRSATNCSGQPYWQTRVTAKGDGVLRSPAVRVKRVGFYTYRERVAGSLLVAEATTECALAAETSLVAPQILTGRGDPSRLVRARSAADAAPTRVQLASLGIDAPVSPVGIDTVKGVLGVSPNIHRTGWWRDGAAPGATSGAILIAGHVDSAKAGAGAFFKLHLAKAGDRVQVTAGGRTYAYRVVSVRSYLKTALPTSVYSQKGAPRLVLVTCGGPFLEALGHYRDNIVLTAVPA